MTILHIDAARVGLRRQAGTVTIDLVDSDRTPRPGFVAGVAIVAPLNLPLPASGLLDVELDPAAFYLVVIRVAGEEREFLIEIVADLAEVSLEDAQVEDPEPQAGTLLAQERAARIAADAALESALATETAARVAGDAQLGSDLAVEAATREAEDLSLAGDLATETSAREAGDVSLGDRIDGEVAAREAGDIALAGDLAGEVSARVAADAGLADDIAAVEAASVPVADLGQPAGVATLDGAGHVPAVQLPPLVVTDTHVVDSEAEMLALVAQVGDVAIRTDVSRSYMLRGSDPSELGDWQELLSPPNEVTSVAGKVGDVVLDGADITSGTVADARIAASIARDSEVAAARAAAEATAASALAAAVGDLEAADTALGARIDGEESARAAAVAGVASDLSDHEGLTTGAHGGVVADDDARLSDDRYPTAHAASHGSGGGDELALAGEQITSGTVAEARIDPVLARAEDVAATRARTVTSDAFDRAPGALGTSDAAHGGVPQAWESIDGAVWVIAGGGARLSGGSYPRAQVLDAGHMDHEVAVRVAGGSDPDPDGAQVQCGLVCARVESAAAMVLAEFSAGVLAVSVVSAGGSTVLASAPHVLAVDQVIALRVVGDRITVSVDGAVTIDVTAADLPRGTRCGLASSTGVVARLEVDDVVVTAFPPTGGSLDVIDEVLDAVLSDVVPTVDHGVDQWSARPIEPRVYWRGDADPLLAAPGDLWRGLGELRRVPAAWAGGSYVGVETTWGANVSSTSVDVPTGVVDGDLLIAYAVVSDSTATVSPLAGWTEIYSTAADNNAAMWCGYRVAAAEPVSYDIVPSSAATAGAAITAYRGVAYESMVAAFDAAAPGMSYPEVTTEGPDRLVVCIGSLRASGTWAAGPYLHAVRRLAAGYTNRPIMVADRGYRSAGPTGPADASTTGSVVFGRLLRIVLAPAT